MWICCARPRNLDCEGCQGEEYSRIDWDECYFQRRDILATELQSRGCSSATSSINRITADMKNTKEIRGFARIASKTDVCILANSTSIVNVVGPHRKPGRSKSLCIEPIVNGPNEIVIPNSVCASDKNTFAVEVANPKESDVWIKGNTRIGMISECDVDPLQSAKVEFVSTAPGEETVVRQEDVTGDAPVIYPSSLVPDDL